MHCTVGKYFWKYTIFAVCLYIVLTKGVSVSFNNNNQAGLTIVLATALVIILDNIEYFKPMCNESFKKVDCNKAEMPTLDIAPKYNENNNFQTHDENMVYKPNFYSAGGYPPDMTLDDHYQPPLVQEGTQQCEYHRF